MVVGHREESQLFCLDVGLDPGGQVPQVPGGAGVLRRAVGPHVLGHERVALVLRRGLGRELLGGDADTVGCGFHAGTVVTGKDILI